MFPLNWEIKSGVKGKSSWKRFCASVGFLIVLSHTVAEIPRYCFSQYCYNDQHAKGGVLKIFLNIFHNIAMMIITQRKGFRKYFWLFQIVFTILARWSAHRWRGSQISMNISNIFFFTILVQQSSHREGGSERTVVSSKKWPCTAHRAVVRSVSSY